MASIFGGSERVNTLTEPQTWLAAGLANQAIRGYNRWSPEDAYQGELVSGPTALQQAVFNYAPGQLGNVAGAQPAINSMLAGESAIGVDPMEYYYQSVVAPSKIGFEDTLRDIETRYGSGFNSTDGGFAEILGDSAAEYNTGLNAILGQLMFDERNVANDQRMAGVNATLAYPGAMNQELGGLLEIGGAERQIGQQENEAAYNQWLSQQEYMNPWLNMAGQVLNVQPYAVGQQQGILPGLGGLAGGLIAGASFF